MKTEFVRARIEPDLKFQVHTMLKELGVTPTQAITMFYKFIKREHGLPFELTLPNKETQRAIEEARRGEGVVVCKDSREFFKKLGL